MIKSILKKGFYSFLLVFTTLSVYAQDNAVVTTAGSKSSLLDYLYNNFLFILTGLVLLGTFAMAMKLIDTMMDLQKIRLMEEQGIEAMERANLLEKKSMFSRFYDWLWSVVPVKEEKTIDLGHDYDGIRELDNRLPPWWLLLFYGSIIFGAIYMYYYHWSDSGWSSRQEYEMAMEQAEIERAKYLDKMANAVNENNVVAVMDEASLAEGAEIFKINCLACHGPDGGGTVGPNLTDEYWIHGGGIKNIFATIKNGVPEKGMIPWKTQLRPAAMQKVASFVLSLQGTTPASGKAQEGERWVPQEEEVVPETEAASGNEIGAVVE